MDYPAAFVEELLGLSHLKVNDSGIQPMLVRVADLATRELEGCDMAGVTLVRDGRPVTAVFTHPTAPEIDAAQYESGHGPCLDAYRDGKIFRITDAVTDNRWPEFSRTALAYGIHSALALPLRSEDATIGALNLYSRQPDAFAEDDQITAVFAAHAAAVLATSQAFWAAHALSEQLQTAIQTRAIIEQAKGILMRDHGCDADAAFELLKQESQHTNRKLHQVATTIVEAAIHDPPADDT